MSEGSAGCHVGPLWAHVPHWASRSQCLFPRLPALRVTLLALTLPAATAAAAVQTNHWGNWRDTWQDFRVDSTAPTIVAPPDVTAEQLSPDGSPVGRVDLGTPTVTDSDDPNPVVTKVASAIFPPGLDVVTWTATDRSGKSASATQRVEVADTTPPLINLAVLRRTIPHANKKLVLATEVTAVDACDPAPAVGISVSASDSAKPGKGGRPKTDWEIVRQGDVWQVWLRAEPAAGPSAPRVCETIDVWATDGLHNTATAVDTVVVP